MLKPNNNTCKWIPLVLVTHECGHKARVSVNCRHVNPAGSHSYPYPLADDWNKWIQGCCSLWLQLIQYIITFDCISIRLLFTFPTAVSTPLTPSSTESLNTKAAIIKPLGKRRKILFMRKITLYSDWLNFSW